MEACQVLSTGWIATSCLKGCHVAFGAEKRAPCRIYTNELVTAADTARTNKPYCHAVLAIKQEAEGVRVG